MSRPAPSDVLFEVSGPDVEAWREIAACNGRSDVDFFPASDDPAAADRAKAVCVACAVADECLAFALHTDQPDGIWGGLTTRQRNRLRREWLRDVGEAEAS